MRILVAEDERSLAGALQKILETEGFSADIVYDGRTALCCALEGEYDILVLDVMMPELDGFAVVKELRSRRIATPILILTARTATKDIVYGLNAGADDYMTKPFEPEEFLARVWALTRRGGSLLTEELCFGDLRLELNSGLLHCGEDSVQLSRRELEMARILFTDPGRTVSKETLLNRIWGYGTDASENNVEAYISFLRKKFRFLRSRVSIRNVQRFGYRLEEAGC